MPYAKYWMFVLRFGAPSPTRPGQTAGSAHLKTLTGHKGTVTGLEIIPRSGHLVSCGADGFLLIWDYTTDSVLKKFAHKEEFRCLALR